jgi:hypothetical protein
MIHEFCTSCERRRNQEKLYSKKQLSAVRKANEEYSVIKCLECGALSFLLARTPKGKSRPIRFVFSGDDADESYYLFLDYEHKELMPKKIR